MTQVTDTKIALAVLKRLRDEMKTSSDGSAQASTLAERAKGSAEQGFMALTDVQETLNSFVDSSGEINMLLEEIDLLTQQVHVLGVNAAIEAANAGEKGSGFSIIAVEMRRLAGEVKKTAGDINVILELTGGLAEKTVKAMEAASETLEVLQVSADLTIELTGQVAESVRENYQQLEKLISE